jgi:hypothetical protein
MDLGIDTHVWCLVVLHDAAESPLGSTQGSVQHVDVHLLRVTGFLKAASNFQLSRLCAPEIQTAC